MKLELIEDWKNVWKWWSTYAVVALTIWNMMPLVVQGLIPAPLHLIVSLVLFVSFVLARITGQPKLKEKPSE